MRKNAGRLCAALRFSFPRPGGRNSRKIGIIHRYFSKAGLAESP